jgi:adenine deaminase
MVGIGFGYKDTRMLVSCAMGRIPADIVLKDGIWACVQSGEFIPHTDIAIFAHRIAYVGENADHTIGKNTRVIQAKGRYLVPGLLDAHMHVESGMVTVTEFVRAVIPHGTTGMFVDPHEIANVFGLRGVRLMVDEAQQQPIHVFVQMPSCVPSAPGLETPGESMGPAEVAEAMTWPGIIGLGEMMNFPGVYNSDDKVHSEMAITRQANKVIGGHYASNDLGLPFHGYAAGGPTDDHEGTRMEDAIVRARQGMTPMLRYGSGWHDVEAQAPALTKSHLDSSRFVLCTDDSHSQTLISEGHMDRVLRHAISVGIPPMTALQMSTINTAEYFGVNRSMGLIAPGRYADVLLVKDIKDFHPDLVISNGQVLAENGKLLMDLPAVEYPIWALDSVHLPDPLTPKDFCVQLPEGVNPKKAIANVIGVIEDQAPTRHLRIPVEVTGCEVKADPKNDLAKIALVERHHSTGRVQVGFVNGFGFNVDCAVASTVAHDCHHMIVVGTNNDSMAIAANALADMGGGQVVVKGKKVIGKVELKIAGLMSNERAEIVAKKAATVLKGFKACGCNLDNPNMQLSLLSLAVIPELRITDLGLVDVNKFCFIPVLENRE